MNFNSLIHMDQYGIYVWTTYSITILVFCINLGMVFFEKKSIKKIFKLLAHATRSK